MKHHSWPVVALLAVAINLAGVASASPVSHDPLDRAVFSVMQEEFSAQRHHAKPINQAKSACALPYEVCQWYDDEASYYYFTYQRGDYLYEVLYVLYHDGREERTTTKTRAGRW